LLGGRWGRHGLDIGEECSQAGLVGLGVADVAGAGGGVLNLHGVTKHMLEDVDDLEQALAGAEGKVHRAGAGHSSP
jgi:hypothetical protein